MDFLGDDEYLDDVRLRVSHDEIECVEWVNTYISNKPQQRLLALGKYGFYIFKRKGSTLEKVRQCGYTRIVKVGVHAKVSLVLDSGWTFDFEASEKHAKTLVSIIIRNLHSLLGGTPALAAIKFEHILFTLNPGAETATPPAHRLLGGLEDTYASLCLAEELEPAGDITFAIHEALKSIPQAFEVGHHTGGHPARTWSISRIVMPALDTPSKVPLHPLFKALWHNTWFDTLEVFGVRQQPITKGLTGLLHSNSSLTCLRIVDSKLDWSAFFDALSSANFEGHGLLRCLRELDLSNCGGLKDKVLTLESTKDALRRFTLAKLDVSRNEMTPKGVSLFLDALSKNSFIYDSLKALNLSFNKFGTEASDKLLAFLTARPRMALSTLLLGHCCPTNPDALLEAMAASHSTIRVLDLRGVVVAKKTAIRLQEAIARSSVSDLDVSDAVLHEAVQVSIIEGLAPARPSIDEVKVALTGIQLSPPTVALIAKIFKEHRLSRLSSLSLDGCGIGETEVAILGESLVEMSCLHTLSLSANLRASKQTRLALACLNKVFETGRMECLLLAGTKGRRIGPDLATIFPSLSKCKRLHTLDISDNEGGDAAICALASFVENCPSLTSLHCDENNTTLQGIHVMGLAIKESKSLFDFSLFPRDLERLRTTNKDEFAIASDVMFHMRIALSASREAFNSSNNRHTSQSRPASIAVHATTSLDFETASLSVAIEDALSASTDDPSARSNAPPRSVTLRWYVCLTDEEEGGDEAEEERRCNDFDAEEEYVREFEGGGEFERDDEGSGHGGGVSAATEGSPKQLTSDPRDSHPVGPLSAEHQEQTAQGSGERTSEGVGGDSERAQASSSESFLALPTRANDGGQGSVSDQRSALGRGGTQRRLLSDRNRMSVVELSSFDYQDGQSSTFTTATNSEISTAESASLSYSSSSSGSGGGGGVRSVSMPRLISARGVPPPREAYPAVVTPPSPSPSPSHSLSPPAVTVQAEETTQVPQTQVVSTPAPASGAEQGGGTPRSTLSPNDTKEKRGLPGGDDDDESEAEVPPPIPLKKSASGSSLPLPQRGNYYALPPPPPEAQRSVSGGSLPTGTEAPSVHVGGSGPSSSSSSSTTTTTTTSSGGQTAGTQKYSFLDDSFAIPPAIVQSVEFLEVKGLYEPSIFCSMKEEARASGFLNAFVAGKKLKLFDEAQDPLLAASVVWLSFRDLPNVTTPLACCHALVACVNAAGSETSESLSRAASYAAVVRGLSRPRWGMLRRLCMLFKAVADNYKYTHSDVASIALFMSPVILACVSEPSTRVMILTDWISHHDVVFSAYSV